jgi:hypothetical protein
VLQQNGVKQHRRSLLSVLVSNPSSATSGIMVKVKGD